MNANDMHQTDRRELRRLADGLKQDAQALWHAGNKAEAMKLFRLFQRITRELHRRRNPSHVHLWN